MEETKEEKTAATIASPAPNLSPESKTAPAPAALKVSVPATSNSSSSSSSSSASSLNFPASIDVDHLVDTHCVDDDGSPWTGEGGSRSGTEDKAWSLLGKDASAFALTQTVVGNEDKDYLESVSFDEQQPGLARRREELWQDRQKELAKDKSVGGRRGRRRVRLARRRRRVLQVTVGSFFTILVGLLTALITALVLSGSTALSHVRSSLIIHTFTVHGAAPAFLAGAGFSVGLVVTAGGPLGGLSPGALPPPAPRTLAWPRCPSPTVTAT